MQKSTHINIWLTTTLWLIYATATFNIFFLYYYFISLIPDLDHNRWTLTSKLWFSLPFRHRWFTHTLLFILILQGVINISFYFLYTKFWIGNVLTIEDNKILFILLHAHLFADIFTVSWIPYLYPFIKKSIKIPWISIFSTWKTGEYFFNIVVSIINILLLYLIYKSWILTNLNWLKKTQEFILTNNLVSWIILITFIILGAHLISYEIKKIWKDTKNSIKKIWKMFINLVWTIVFLSIIWIGINYYIPTIDIIFILLWIISLTIVSFVVQFNKHIELLSKTTWYILNIFVLLVIFLMSFNIINFNNFM